MTKRRSFASYNEKCMHVWKPETEEQIYYANFFDETYSHSISYLLYSQKYHVRVDPDEVDSYTWRSQLISNYSSSTST